MKRIIVVFTLASFCALSFAQRPRVAVFVTGGKTVNEDEVLASYMLDAFVKSGLFEPLERSDVSLSMSAREHIKQRDGSVDDSLIVILGRQYGARYVCNTMIRSAFGTNQVAARVVDIKTTVVMASGVETSPLNSMKEVESVSNRLVQSMMGKLKSGIQKLAEEGIISQLETMYDSRDGKSYKVWNVGGVSWMMENLKYRGKERYNRKEAFGDVCPSGWSLPNQGNWELLKSHMKSNPEMARFFIEGGGGYWWSSTKRHNDAIGDYGSGVGKDVRGIRGPDSPLDMNNEQPAIRCVGNP